MSEEPEPAQPEGDGSIDFSRVPWLPKSPILNLALGFMLGAFAGLILIIAILPPLSPTMELRGLVTRVENGVMTIEGAKLEVQGLSIPNLQGYLVEMRVTMLKLYLRGQNMENLFPVI